MNSTRSWVRPKLLDIDLDYTYGTFPKDIMVDIGSRGREHRVRPSRVSQRERSGSRFSGDTECVHPGQPGVEGRLGYITVPMYFRCGGMGTVTFSDIQILFDRPPYVPQLVGPADGSFNGNTPVLR